MQTPFVRAAAVAAVSFTLTAGSPAFSSSTATTAALMMAQLAPGNVIGRDDRTPHTARTVTGRTVGQVRQHDGSRWTSNCTGTLVGPRLVLTAHHCVALSGNRLSILTDTYFLPAVVDGEMPRGAKAVKAVNVWTGNPYADTVGGDWAILLLESIPSSDEYRSFGWAGVTSPLRLMPNHPLAAIGYSGDFRNGDTAGKALNCRILQYFPGSTGFTHDCDCDHGASGGPMFAGFTDGTVAIIGNMVAQVDEAKALLLGILTNRHIPAVNMGAGAHGYLDTLLRLRRIYD